jgi:single-strand DNA-binding protein
MNVVILTGRITRDLELKFSKDGKTYCKFNIAVDNPFKKDSADFINCSAFGKTAEILEKYSGKGKKIGVEGRLQMNKYEKDGEQRTTFEVMVNQVEFLEFKEKTENTSSENSSSGVEDQESFPF